MGILTRLFRLINGKANSVIDGMENRNIEIVTEQNLRDYNEKVREVRAAIGNFEAEINIMQDKLNKNTVEIERLNKLADTALEQGEDSLAVDYESSIMELENTNLIYQKQIDANLPKLEELTKSYAQLLDKRNNAQLKIKEISAKQKILQARTAVEDTLGTAPGSIAADLDKIVENTDRKLFSQDAQDKLDNGPNHKKRMEFESQQQLGNVNQRIAERRNRMKQSNQI